MPRKIMVVGNGGREHALVWKLLQELDDGDIIYITQKEVLERMYENVESIDIDPADTRNLAHFALEENVYLTIVGPEESLAYGVVDEFQRLRLPIFGPSKKAAMIETSKLYAKRFMERNHIPTPRLYYSTSDALDAEIRAKDLLRAHGGVVIKNDGLAKGKGVHVCTTLKDVLRGVHELFQTSSPRVLLEELIAGEEVSFIVWTDGEYAIPLVTAQDFKRAYGGNMGPSTGGMGAYTRPAFVSGMEDRIMRDIIVPTIEAHNRNGNPYKGALYAGLMISNGEPYVLEFNARYGDPETQPTMMLLESSLIDVSIACITGQLHKVTPRWSSQEAACIVLATQGYPYESQYNNNLGMPLCIPDELPEYAMIFHASTGYRDDQLVNTGGRVLGVTTTGKNQKEAFERGYDIINSGKIRSDIMQLRRDLIDKAH